MKLGNCALSAAQSVLLARLLLLAWPMLLSGAPETGAKQTLILEDPLTSSATVKGESLKTSRGGQYSSKGWRALSNGDFLMIALAEAYGFEGTLEIDITDLDWAKANTAAGKDKIHFINMFSSPRSDHHVEHGGSNADALWTLRGGAAPDGSPAYGNRFAVLLASRGAKRAEPSDYEESVAPMVNGWTWNQERYKFRVTWSKTGGQLLGYINGQLMFHEPWVNQVVPLQYIYIGKGPEFHTFIGPVFSNLRVYSASRTQGSVNSTPSVSLLQPRNGAVVKASSPIEIVADAIDDGRLRKVEFYEGKTKIGESIRPPYTIQLPGLKPGWYSLTAKATDDTGLESVSRPKFITVGTPWKPWGVTEGASNSPQPR
ncbi:MAG: Ig-like domain-containing protein [Bryobacteraceae bacterium]|nr:Ig-like domain-containing protein [Bryobacteraceae bacterium]